jgi:hypothetical protein
VPSIPLSIVGSRNRILYVDYADPRQCDWGNRSFRVVLSLDPQRKHEYHEENFNLAFHCSLILSSFEKSHLATGTD